MVRTPPNTKTARERQSRQFRGDIPGMLQSADQYDTSELPDHKLLNLAYVVAEVAVDVDDAKELLLAMGVVSSRLKSLYWENKRVTAEREAP